LSSLLLQPGSKNEAVFGLQITNESIFGGFDFRHLKFCK
jgi:hypothetical protein